MNFWYSARSTEIFLDLDSRKSLLRAMKIIRSWHGCTRPVKVWHYPTLRDYHSHVVIEWSQGLCERFRAELALWMGSDKLRACYVFSRQNAGLKHSDLLVSVRPYHRSPDAVCHCEGKHKDKAVTDRCPALKLLLGEWRSFDWFPRAGRKRMKPLRIPVGRVPLTLIRKWRTDGSRE